MNNKLFPVVDLHSDLLSYLIYKKDRTPYDAISRSSYEQLISGHVKLQTLAIAAIPSPTSVQEGEQQVAFFRVLLDKYSHAFSSFEKNRQISLSSANQVHLLPAIENASAFASEDEPLSDSLARLQTFIDAVGPLFYISLTWNGENRFGGGVGSSSGLKEDGEQLLCWLDHKRIAVDLSHTSDRLAREIFECIDKHNLKIPLIASHSNFREVTSVDRNLPDDIAKELIRREGLIGINLFAPFISYTDPEVLLHHVEHALSIGAEQVLCFGADFFCDADFPILKEKYRSDKFYLPEFSNASAYPYILKMFEDKLLLDEETLKNIASRNALNFLRKKIFTD